MTTSEISSTPFDWLSDLRPVYAARDAWHRGDYDQTFHWAVLPDSTGPFVIACGGALLAEHIRRFRFSPEVIQRLGRVSDDKGRAAFDESFLNHLQRLRLRVSVSAPPEGMVLLPGEPLALARGPLDQLTLLESAFRLLFLESTRQATRAARKRWADEDWVEEDTPPAPLFPFNPDGWRRRAAYIGGETGLNPDLKNDELPEAPANFLDKNSPLIQIRRLFKGSQPLGDVWLTREQEKVASVSKTTVHFRDEHTHRTRTVHFTRFQNLYQPVLSKGHPVLAAPRPGYLRQRMLKQIEAFQQNILEGYGTGWWQS